MASLHARRSRPTFAVDPNFRVGYAQAWQLSVQRDLPAALQLTATYLGIKGTRGVQQFLPNTYPVGAANPCPACPSGFVYQTSVVTPRARRDRSNYAADCATDSARRFSTPIQNRSTTIRCSADWVTSPPVGKARLIQHPPARRLRLRPRHPRPSHRTGSISMPSVRFPPSISVICSTCKCNTQAVRASAEERS